MGQIKVKFDHKLKQPRIVTPLVYPASGETNKPDITGGNTPYKQTALYGIVTPLVRVNDIVIDIDSVLYFELDGKGRLPKLELTILDKSDIIKGLQNPGTDNEVRIQILPRLENAYKKIDMTFYIKHCDNDDNVLYLSCIYKIPNLYNNRVKCFGELSSYEFFEKVANECQLGFATNVESTNDKRYLYCAYESYNELMEKTISTSGDDLQNPILYDYWIDYWNNINFVNIYERFNSVDKDEDMMIYVNSLDMDLSQTSKDEENYTKMVATLSNDPRHQDMELSINQYDTIVNSYQNSDKVFSVYNMGNDEHKDFFFQDKNQLKDIFLKYEYVGENYRDYNYLLASSYRELLLNKMKSEIIEVSLKSPLLQLIRGGKVNIMWYDTNNILDIKKKQLGIKDEDIETNIPIDPQQGTFEYNGPLYRINKEISGQYLILNSVIRYEDYNWSCDLQLTRPKVNKIKYLDISEETKDIK